MSDSVSLVGVPVCIPSSAVGLEVCALAVRIKHKSIIKKKRNKYDCIVLLAKANLNNKVLFSKPSHESYISHGEFASVNNVLKNINKWKKKKKIDNAVEYAV